MKMDVRFIEIPVSIYGIHVIVALGATTEQIVKMGKRHGVFISDEWRNAISKEILGDCSGYCTSYGNSGNTDVLVWIRKWPKKATEYNTLYHELYHAVRRIARSHHLKGENESQAFLYGFLATECNKIMWNRR